jgi:hypothetical protein
MKLALIVFLALAVFLLGCTSEMDSCYSTKETSNGAANHIHEWCAGELYTKEFCIPQGACHKHWVNVADNIAEPAGIPSHTHKLK